MILLETAIATFDDAAAAQLGGADRLELSTALEVGGLTPSIGALDLIKESISLPVIAMLRPRSGGFVYSESDLRTMERDADLLLRHGADGLAFGCLKRDGNIDFEQNRAMIELIGAKDVVFHRAFDLTPDPFASLESLIELKVTRILTSGQKQTASDGAELIRKLVLQAAGRIEILPGGGITPANAKGLLQQTGATQIHGSFSVLRRDAAQPVCGDELRITSAELVASTRIALRGSE